MTDPEGFMYHLVRRFKLPRYLASTSTNGLSNQYRYFLCRLPKDTAISSSARALAREADRDRHSHYDNCAAYLDNDFPLRDYVLVATSDARETTTNLTIARNSCAGLSR